MKFTNRSFEAGREEEVARLTRFLEYKPGGSLILGGDRGSGKTTLVNIAIERMRYQHPNPWVSSFKRVQSIWFSRVVKLDIPLIIIEPKSTPEEVNSYRSMLMRAILIGLEADLSKRYYSWLDLPVRWFRSIGYIQKVYSLKPYTQYLRFNKSISKSIGGSLNFGSSAKFGSVVQAEIDLTDSTIEIKLRNLLLEYSGKHNFILVFDELDKLPPESATVESIVLHLKNLFSETGVHAIFISSEKDLKRIIGKAKQSNPPLEENTLFVDWMLLNNLKLDEFSKIVSSRVVTNDQEDMNEMIAPLSYHTRRSPHELNKLFIRYGDNYTDLMRGLSIELGAEKLSKFGVMQRYVDFIYSEYSGLYDGHFSRLLEKTLQRTAIIILESDSVLVGTNNPESILYTPDYFEQDDISKEQAIINEKAFKQDVLTNSIDTAPEIIEELLLLLENDQSEQYFEISSAIEKLIILLNRSNNLPITDTDTKGIYELKGITEKNFTYSNISDDLSTVFDLTDLEENMLNKLTKFNAPYKAMTGNSLQGDLQIVSEARSEENFSFKNCKTAWEQITPVVAGIEQKFLAVIIEKLSTKTTTPLDQAQIESDGNSVNISLKGGSKLRLTILFAGSRIKEVSGISKTYIFRCVGSEPRKGKVSSSIKNYSMNESFSGLDTKINEISVWVNANTKL